MDINEILTNIYTLHEPNGELRYVGKTIKTPERRLRLHISNAKRFDPPKSYLGCWIRALLVRGLEPEVRLLQTVRGEIWVEVEKFWIAHFREQGCRLVNLSDGGEGPQGYRHPPETRALIAAANTGKKHSAESRKLMSEIALRRPPRPPGYRHSEESKKRMSKAQAKRDNTNLRASSVSRRTVNPDVVVRPDDQFERSVEWRKKIGISNSGSNNGCAKLDELKVAKIKELLVAGQLTQQEIAEQFLVTRPLIGLIQRNKRWAHVPWPIAI